MRRFLRGSIAAERGALREVNAAGIVVGRRGRFRRARRTTLFFSVIAILSVVIVAVLLFLVLFEPSLGYKVHPLEKGIGSEDFLRLLGTLSDAPVHRDSGIEVLVDGKEFYEAELAAIAAATHSIHFEAFIFHPGEVGRRFVEALAGRARAGVRVKVIVDAIGSLITPDSFFDPLRDAGGRVAWYQPIRWYTIKRLNNRTHRKLIVLDGKLGFIGGADVGDNWYATDKKGCPWRDTVLRVEGALVAGLQTTFAENWLESAEEVLLEEAYFPVPPPGDGKPLEERPAGMVVISTPTGGRSSRARMLFQVLMASAQQSIQITSPYFLPDRSARAELIRAHQRGVKVQVLVPGKLNNHPMTRHASRRRYGELLRAGIEIWEYQPRMIHAKVMLVDGLWSVVGSTNFDSRSFELNDEVNLVNRDAPLAAKLEADLSNDLGQSERVTYEQWARRPISDRFLEAIGRVLERQE